MSRHWFMEWLASALVVTGVVLIGMWASTGSWVPLVIGSALLTWGVRLAIDCGKRGER